MIYEGVNFNAGICAEMTKEEFVDAHIVHLWQGRDEATRRKMLESAYVRINPTKAARQKKRKEETE